MASCGYSDEDQTAYLKEKVGSRRGIVPTNHVRHGNIVIIQSIFSESDGPHFSR